MSVKSRLMVAVLVTALVTSTGVAFVSAQSDEYSVQAEHTIDIPDQETTVQGTNYTVSSIGRVMVGETLNAETSGPEGETFGVDLYTGDQGTIEANDDSGSDGSVSFSTQDLQPGTYVLVVYTEGGSNVAPQPVVVAGYETTLNAPSEITAGESNNVSVQLNDVADLDSPENVELVVAQDETVVSTTQMSQESTYEFSADIGSSLESGEYRVYAMVHNESTIDDDNDIVGVSDPQTLTVTSDGESEPQAEEDGGQSSDGDSSDGNDGDDGSSGSSSNYDSSSDDGSSDVSASTETATVTATATEIATTVQSTETTEDQTTTTGMEATPVSNTVTPTEGTESTMPNFALYIVALALIAAALIARR